MWEGKENEIAGKDGKFLVQTLQGNKDLETSRRGGTLGQPRKAKSNLNHGVGKEHATHHLVHLTPGSVATKGGLGRGLGLKSIALQA